MCGKACTHDNLKLSHRPAHAVKLPFKKFSFGPVCFNNVKVVFNYELFAAFLAEVAFIFGTTQKKLKVCEDMLWKFLALKLKKCHFSDLELM